MNGQISLIPGYEYDPPTPTEFANANRKFKKPIEMYGPGPAGATCKTCEHCCSYRQSRKWYKCDQWKRSSSQATDIRLKWPACGRYEKDKKK